MNTKFKLFTLVCISTLLIACDTGSDSPWGPGGASSNEPISDKNFELVFDPVIPEVLDDDGYHANIPMTITALAGDRFGKQVSSGTVHIRTEWGILDATSCEINNGSCSVTWTSDSNFGFIPNDLRIAITAYTYGEESYVDLNGSGNFDDADGNTYSRDMDEPYIDLDHDRSYTVGVDEIIDIDRNGSHTLGDGLFNGKGCTHSSLCGSPSIISISGNSLISLDAREPVANIALPAAATTLGGVAENFVVDATAPTGVTIIGRDNPTAGFNIVWRSSIEGVFSPTNSPNSNNNITVNTSGWASGAHVITVTVTNSNGKSTTDTVSITIP